MLGAFGIGLGGGISCALASQMASTKHPFKALVTLYGTPLRGFDARQITKTTPIQGHFGGKVNLKREKNIIILLYINIYLCNNKIKLYIF